MTMEGPADPHGGSATQHEERPLTALFSDLAGETSSLIRKELELAKTEISEKASQAGKGAASLAMGGAIAFAGVLFLLAALVLILDLVLPTWAAALIVGLVVVGVGYGLVAAGKKKLTAKNLVPKRTIETIKDDGRWAKSQVGR
ncbi:MAG TPA: phage holin family protein [Azospirillaceae bacterium]|nr:phage holin family protein [Azospirillaceae bacterium]